MFKKIHINMRKALKRWLHVRKHWHQPLEAGVFWTSLSGVFVLKVQSVKYRIITVFPICANQEFENVNLIVHVCFLRHADVSEFTVFAFVCVNRLRSALFRLPFGLSEFTKSRWRQSCKTHEDLLISTPEDPVLPLNIHWRSLKVIKVSYSTSHFT